MHSQARTPALLLAVYHRTLPRNLRFEIAKPRPKRALVQVHFGDADGSPFSRATSGKNPS